MHHETLQAINEKSLDSNWITWEIRENTVLLQEAVITVLGAGLTLGILFGLSAAGKYLEIGSLQSPGGMLVSTVVMIEFLFLAGLGFLAVTCKI